MERHELEDRIRASLQARADDVQPTPELWERVSERTTRRARWELGGWVLSGAAAVVAIVVGGMVLFGGPRSVQIDQQPDIADTPTGAPVPGPTADPTIVTTDGQLLRVVEPGTGEVQLEVDPRAGLAEGATIEELAVRPDTGDGMLTVAMTLELEGEFDVEVAVFDADGQRVDRLNLGMAGSPVDAGLPPSPVWSADGQYVLWAGTNGPSSPALWVYDWVERPVDGNGIAQAVQATAPGADGALFAEGGTVDLRTWQGPSDGESVVVATSPTGGAWRIALAAQASDCGGATPCPPTWNAAISPIGIEGGSLVDVATLASGVDLSLVGGSGQPGDAEGGTLTLVAGAMGDQQRELDVPELLPGGSAAPIDGWLAAAGDQVAVGFGPVTGYLLSVEGDTIEDVEVSGTVALPEGTTDAAMALPATGDAATSAPSDSGGDDVGDPADGVPGHVVVSGPGRGQLRLVERATGTDVATWNRPEGLETEAVPGSVAVYPGSRPGDLQVVTRWTVGEAESLVWTRVRAGQVVANEVLPDTMQPTNTGTIAEVAESNPVFSPDGTWLAWVETPRGRPRPPRSGSSRGPRTGPSRARSRPPWPPTTRPAPWSCSTGQPALTRRC